MKRKSVEHLVIDGKQYEHAKSIPIGRENMLYAQSRARSIRDSYRRKGLSARIIKHKDSYDIYVKNIKR